MKKVLHIFLFIAVTSCAVFAQTDFDEPRWTKFENKSEEFTVNFPNDKVGGIPRKTAQNSAAYSAVHNKTYFNVFSEDLNALFYYRDLKEYATGSGAEAPKEITIDGLKGLRYDFKGMDEYEHSFITIQAPDHFYIFLVMSETRDNSMIEEFFSSIHFDDKLAEVMATRSAALDPLEKTDAKTDAKPAAEADYKSIFNKPLQAGTFDAGSVISPSQHALNGTVAPPKYSKVDSGVTILTQPKPAYTDIARKFQISGVVRLRVTFEKNGQIAEIVPVQKLPLGLTQKAMGAARSIKFSPAVKQGEPYATTKIVQYNFTIY